MKGLRRWSVDVFVGEDDGFTYAEAALQDDLGNQILGTGRARLNPTDPDVPEIGDEIAVARALSDLGHRLLSTAAADLATVTHEPVVLPR
jgi:Rv2632c-like